MADRSCDRPGRNIRFDSRRLPAPFGANHGKGQTERRCSRYFRFDSVAARGSGGWIFEKFRNGHFGSECSIWIVRWANSFSVDLGRQFAVVDRKRTLTVLHGLEHFPELHWLYSDRGFLEETISNESQLNVLASCKILHCDNFQLYSLKYS